MDSQRVWWSRSDRYFLLALIALPFIAFPMALRGDTSIVAGDGIISLPYRVLTARRVFSGEWPFWAPEILGGIDLWTYPASGVLSPVTYLFGIFPPLWLTNVISLLVYSLALVGVYIFSRMWGLGRTGSTAAAISYAFSGFFYSYHSFTVLGMAQAGAFTPLLLAAYYHLALNPGPRRAAIAALATFIMGIIPQDQIFTYSMLHAALVTCAVSWSADKNKRFRIWRWAALAAALGTLAFAARILPAIYMLDYSIREEIAGLINKSYSLRYLVSWQTIFNPFESSGRVPSLFFGEVSFFLALMGLLYAREVKNIRWAAAGVLLGWAGIFFSLVIPLKWQQALPLVGLFHTPGRHLFEVFFWASILAGAGMDAFSSQFRARRATIMSAILATAIPGAAMIWYINLVREIPPAQALRSCSFISLSLFVLVGIYLIASTGRGKIFKWSALGLVFLLMFGQRQMIFKSLIKSEIDRNDVVAHDRFESPAVKFLKERQGRSRVKGPLSRGIYLGHIYKFNFKLAQRINSASPNTNMLSGLDLVQAKNELLSRRLNLMLGGGLRYGFFRNMKIFNQYSPVLDLLNVRYVLAPTYSLTDDPRDWPAYREYALGNYTKAILMKVDYDNPMRVSWEGVEGANRLAILANHGKTPLVGPMDELRFLVMPSDNGLIGPKLTEGQGEDDTGYEIKAINRKSGPGKKVEGRVYWYEIQLPVPSEVGTGVLEITALHPKASLIVFGAVLLDKNDRVLRRIPLAENYIETTLEYKRIYKDSFVTVFERKTAFPRQWLSPRLMVLPSRKILTQLIKTPRSRYNRRRLIDVALVEDDSLIKFGESLAGYSPDRSARIERIVDRPNFISAKVISKSPVFAVFSEAWARGWKATLDGNPVPIYTAYYYLRGIAIPAGEHTIEMRYMPLGFKTGAFISIIALICIAGLALFPPGNRQ